MTRPITIDATAVTLPGTVVTNTDLYLNDERITDAVRIGNEVFVQTDANPEGYWFPLDTWLRIEAR
jgi:hypothetical protein